MPVEDLIVPKPPAELNVDVCVIGSGAGGAVLAYELGKAGKNVAVVEKGGYYGTRWIENSKEEELLALWKNGGSQLSRNYGVNIAQGECVGGSTVINYGVCFETPEPVLEYWRKAFGVKHTPEVMKQAFRRVRDMIKVTRIKDQDNPGLAHQKVKEGGDRLGYSGDWMERNSHAGKKQSMLVSYLAQAEGRNIKIYQNCRAEKILKSNRKASGVEATFTEKASGEQKNVRINSPVVILSAGAIASSELLLRNGLANKNLQVGKHLSIHPAAAVIGEFEKEVNLDVRLPMAYYCDEFSVIKTGKPGFMIESLVLPPFQLGLLFSAIGSYHQRLMKRYPYYAMAGVLVHDEPSGSVTLNWSDEAVTDYSLSDYDQRKLLHGLEEAARILIAAGAKRVLTPHLQPVELKRYADIRLIQERGVEQGSLPLGSAHPQGGNRMGENKTYCVVNSYCESFDVPSLFVCDASVFPTSLGVNPQVSVMAIATVVADYIVENSGKYFG